MVGIPRRIARVQFLVMSNLLSRMVLIPTHPSQPNDAEPDLGAQVVDEGPSRQTPSPVPHKKVSCGRCRKQGSGHRHSVIPIGSTQEPGKDARNPSRQQERESIALNLHRFGAPGKGYHRRPHDSEPDVGPGNPADSKPDPMKRLMQDHPHHKPPENRSHAEFPKRVSPRQTVHQRKISPDENGGRNSPGNIRTDGIDAPHRVDPRLIDLHGRGTWGETPLSTTSPEVSLATRHQLSSVGLLSIGISFLAPLTLFGQASSQENSPSYTRERLLEVAHKVISEAGYAALITLDANGHPRVRVMDPFPPEGEMTIWFATNPHTRKVGEIRADPRVTLYYFDSNSLGYVTISGKARLVNDESEKARHWKEEWEAFYPNRADEYLLIEVTPDWMEVLSLSDGVTGSEENWTPPRVDFGGGP
jgi:general stress protein 26